MSRRRRRSRDSGVRRALMITAMAVLPLSGIGALGWGLTTQLDKVSYDKVTYCYPQDGQHQSAFFLDASFTSGTSGQQDRDLASELMRTFDGLPPNGRLRVFSTAKGVASSTGIPVVDMCAPPATPEEQARIGADEETRPRLIRIKGVARAAFASKVQAHLAVIKDEAKGAIDSPVLEQIRAISRFPFEAPLKHLVVFTDGIQNSDLRQFCRVKGHLPSFAKFAKQPDYELVKPRSLDGVRVDILLVENSRLPSSIYPFCTNREIRTWWPEFFKAAGANVEPLTRIRFGGVG